jgi:tripartite-type tricarboxylate transporter receptor subunit TctC
MHHALRCLSAVWLAACALLAHGQTYPGAPVRVMVGFSAGGPPDTTARRIAERLSDRLGTPVIVENQPGASGTIAAAAVARAQPDGHTLLFGVAANMAVAPATMRSAPYDPVSSFAPIVEVARGPYVWLVRADAPAGGMKEFIAWARSAPGRLNYASPGPGTVHHFATEMLAKAAGLEMVHVPYRGGLYQALLAGEVQGMFESMPGPIPHLEGGKLRALAVTGARRLARLPDVPTLEEQGVPGVDVNSWWGFFAPAATPPAVVERLNKEVNQILADPAMRALLANWGIEPAGGTPQAFAAYVRQENARWKEIVARSGLKLP